MLKILRLSASGLTSSSAPYNQFTLPHSESHDIEITFISIANSGITPPSRIKYSSGNNGLFETIKLIRNKIRNEQFNVIHVHHLNIFLLFLIAAFPYYKSNLSKSVFTLHTSFNLLKLRNMVLFTIASICLPQVVCCSYSSYNAVPKLLTKMFKRKYSIIQNGFNVRPIIKPVNTSGSNYKSQKIRIISVGRLIAGKNHSALIEAIHKSGLTKYELIFIGEGEDKERLMDLTRQYEMMDFVNFMGQIQRNNVYEELNKSDLFVSLSLGEGMPIAVLEAMANGCLMLLSNIPPHLEIDKELGRLNFVNPSDLTGISNAILRITSMSKEEKVMVTSHQQAFVNSNFSTKNMLEKYMKIFLKLDERSES